MAKAKAAAPKKSSAKPKTASAKKSAASATAPAMKAAAKSAVKAAKPASKTVSKSVAKPATKAAPKAEAKPVAKAAPKSTAKPEAKAAAPKTALKTAPAKPTLKKAQAPLAAKPHHMPAAPSSRMTLMKLGFSTKEEAAILAAPHGFKIPDNADEPATLDAQYDFILIFVENITEAEVICASLNPSLRPKGRAWVAWPKGGASDINLDQLSGMVEAEGLQKITSLSLDERWSAVKFMHPKAER